MARRRPGHPKVKSVTPPTGAETTQASNRGIEKRAPPKNMRQLQPVAATLPKIRPNTNIGNWNKLLHRFYEPLVLLHVLDPTRGEQTSRPGLERLPSGDHSLQDLRRSFLDRLSYLCDYEKGGDTVTAIAAASAPLTYHIASNKNPKSVVLPFIRSILDYLSRCYGLGPQGRNNVEADLVRQCVKFGEKRTKMYWYLLQKDLPSCIASLAAASGNEARKAVIDLEHVIAIHENRVELCLFCHQLRVSSTFRVLTQKIAECEASGTNLSIWTNTRHHIGRLGAHVEAVRILVSAAERLPSLFHNFEVEVVECPPGSCGPPMSYDRITVTGIVNRMTKKDAIGKQEIEDRLHDLDQLFQVERRTREEYRNLKPRVHAELTLLEHFHRNREQLSFLDNDRYIGCSKPACYCCSLYIREHPGRFIEPATHQNLYPNWMPPIRTDEAGELEPESLEHEKHILNRMVQKIRDDAEQQIMDRSGKRKKHFDSITGDTYSNANFRLSAPEHGVAAVEICGAIENEAELLPIGEPIGNLDSSAISDVADYSGDPDSEGGVLVDQCA